MELQQSWKNRLKKWQEQNKKSLVEWWDKKSSSIKVLCAAILSAIIFLLIYFAVIKNSSENSVGSWNFIILIVSSPVAFVIWQFRDENSRQQIENQRKDINLKEFQKLSEWVSGAHLPETKAVEKSITKSSFATNDESAVSPKKQITEQIEECSKEYGQKPDTTHFDTFGKWDGAIALQISAIYNLLPFFRGDYGESFRLPAFNLLKSAWQTMQQDSLNELMTENLSDEQRKEIIENLRQKAHSPMGVALTHILLSLNQEGTQLNLRNFPEMLPNICLAGMDFNLSGIKKEAKDLSKLNLQGIDFQGTNLSASNFKETDLFYANLAYANLTSANLSDTILHATNLSFTNLDFSNLSSTYLLDTNLYETKLTSANLTTCIFEWKTLKTNALLLNTKISINNFSSAIYPYWKQTDSQIWENLTAPEQKEAMQKFCNETRMIIFDDDGNVVAKRQS